jgi:hypothetical protein
MAPPTVPGASTGVFKNLLHVKDRTLGVRFFTPQERELRKTEVRDGLICARNQDTGEFAPLTTKGNIDAGTTPSTRGAVLDRSIYALDKDKRDLYTSGNEVIGAHRPAFFALSSRITGRTQGSYKHSTFFGREYNKKNGHHGETGGNGEIGVDGGTLTYLSTKSGHYQPDHVGEVNVLEWCKGNGVDISKAKLRVKLGTPAGSLSTEGYGAISNPTVKEYATRLHMGAFRGLRTSVEGQPIHEFAFGAIVGDHAKDGEFEMCHTIAGPIPGKVLKKAWEEEKLGEFNSIVVNDKNNVTFKFDLPVSGNRVTHLFSRKPVLTEEQQKAEEDRREIKVKADKLAKYGLELDANRLPVAIKLLDLE